LFSLTGGLYGYSVKPLSQENNMRFAFHRNFRKTLIGLAGLISSFGLVRAAQADNSFDARILEVQDRAKDDSSGMQLVAMQNPVHNVNGTYFQNMGPGSSFGNTTQPGFRNIFEKSAIGTFGNGVGTQFKNNFFKTPA
jgi:hypothetical protein